MTDLPIVLGDFAEELQTGRLNPSRGLALAIANAAGQALDHARTAPEAKDIRDKQIALEAWFNAQRAQLGHINILVASRLETERKIGKLLAETTIKGGIRHNSHDGSCERMPSLPEGITYNESSRWQHLAEIDDEDWRTWVDERLKDTGFELSTAAALRYWSEFVAPTLHPAAPARHYEPTDGIPTNAPEPPAPFDEDHDEANYGPQIRTLLENCCAAFENIMSLTAEEEIIDICKTMRRSIQSLQEEME